MTISLTNLGGLFFHTYKNVLTALDLTAQKIHPFSDDLQYLTYRTALIFKLDLLLYEHKDNLDKKRLLLSGKNALHSFLVLRKNMPLSEAKSLSLHDVLIVLNEEINEQDLPQELIRHVEQMGLNFNDYNLQSTYGKYPDYQDEEWDPELWDKRLLQ